MTDLPAEAITAALASLGEHHDVNLWLTCAEGTAGGLLARRELLTRALEAARPHLAAAEREATVDAMYTGAAKAIENAVAAERERCAQLAEKLKFRLYRPAVNGPGGGKQALDVVPLGELLGLLRQGGGGTPATHTYLSTSCLHGEHSYCQSTTGSNKTAQWAKTPACCKFCAAPCVCRCHAIVGQGGEGGST